MANKKDGKAGLQETLTQTNPREFLLLEMPFTKWVERQSKKQPNATTSPGEESAINQTIMKYNPSHLHEQEVMKLEAMREAKMDWKHDRFVQSRNT